MSPPTTVARALAACSLVPVDAKILLGHVLGRDRAWLAAHAYDFLTAEQAKAFDALARRRREGEPVAYLTGRREFYGLDLEITPEVLIPRPETELLVDLALARIPDGVPARVLDLGTGSGAVALAIARERPHARVLGADSSPAAIALARRNAARHGIGNASFIESDWFEGLPRERFDVIAANPPYVAAGDPHLEEGDLRFEPPAALTADGDGLAAIRAIVALAPAYLAPRGFLLLEHGYDQAQAVQALLHEAGLVEVRSARDLAGIWRVTGARMAGANAAP